MTRAQRWTGLPDPRSPQRPSPSTRKAAIRSEIQITGTSEADESGQPAGKVGPSSIEQDYGRRPQCAACFADSLYGGDPAPDHEKEPRDCLGSGQTIAAA